MSALLEINEISKSFGGLQALNNVSLVIEPGETVGLIGPNGSGKSTLFNVITGTIPASSGAIRFRGEDITRLAAHEYPRAIRFVTSLPTTATGKIIRRELRDGRYG